MLDKGLLSLLAPFAIMVILPLSLVNSLQIKLVSLKGIILSTTASVFKNNSNMP